MRYTTLIDIREIPEVYRNNNTRLLYLHLVLLAGYHDDDRDIVRCSLRNLAAQSGLTLSATRHAIAVLIKWRLLLHRKSYFKVVKFIDEKPISPRAKIRKAQELKNNLAADQAQQQEREAREQAQKAELSALEGQGKSSFMVFYEQQLARAAAGDQEAAESVRRNKAQYERHVKQFQNQNK